MKAYFTIKNKALMDEKIREGVDNIFKVVESMNIEIDKFNFTINSTGNDEDNNKDFEESYEYIIRSIRKSDFVIAEMSYASDGVGFEVAFALQEKKPILVLHNDEIRKHLSTPFRGNKSKLLTVRSYQNIEDVKRALDFFVKDLRYLLETKFILILPKEIDRYLEWCVKKKGKPKAEVTRDAIKRLMENDNDYKKELKKLSD